MVSVSIRPSRVRPRVRRVAAGNVRLWRVVQAVLGIMAVEVLVAFVFVAMMHHFDAHPALTCDSLTGLPAQALDATGCIRFTDGYPPPDIPLP